MSCVLFGRSSHLCVATLFYLVENLSMNVLALDINNEPLLRSLKENQQLKIVTGTIRRPKLYPIPDVILLDFDQVFGHNGREVTLMHLSSKLHPQVTIIACSEEWSDGTRKFAKQFGVDDCFDNDKLDELLYRINIYSKAYDAS